MSCRARISLSWGWAECRWVGTAVDPLVLRPERRDELPQSRIPVVQESLHPVGDIVGVCGAEDVILTPGFEVPLFPVEETGLQQSLDGPVGGRPLAVDFLGYFTAVSSMSASTSKLNTRLSRSFSP